ncbi:MAG: pyridoxal phosphate-dependent aminotransferase [Eggerthellaceae bacterium]|nr:pyridoxal phosphate-dependent aminotransferase [Eggerthellaceae bacterium]
MYRYNFDNPPQRRGTASLKWAVAKNELPMWVADMDFPVAPEIKEALRRRVDHGIFGYDILEDSWYEAYITWWKERHGLVIERDWLLFSLGVVASVASIMRRLAPAGGKVLLQTPVYNAFFHVIEASGLRVEESPLVYDGTNYRIDFADLGAKLADPEVTLMVLCNPHNPVGRIWTAEELARIGELCHAHGVTVISDEIHCDVCAPGVEYVAFASVNDLCRDISITCISPTKTFNLAGIQTSAVFAADPKLREIARRALAVDEVNTPNSFAAPAAVSAFAEGGAWLEEMRKYVWENRRLVEETLARALPEVKVVPGKATYLLWVDVSALTDEVKAFCTDLRAETGLFVTPGTVYGAPGEGFFRWNIACPRSTVQDALARLIAFARKERQG